MIKQYLDYITIERRYSPRTVESYKEDLSEFCTFLGCTFETFNPKDVGEDDVRTWILWLTEERKQSPRSIHRRLSGLHSFYRFLLRSGKIDKDVTRKVILPKLDKHLPVFFNATEMANATMMDAAADDYESVRNCLIIEMLYQTGMRQQEMLSLKTTDVRLDEAEIRIFGKRSKERIVPIGEYLISYIEKYLGYRKELDGSEQSDIFFLHKTRKGVKGLSKSTLYDIVKKRMGEVSSREKRSPHVLRHTFATSLLNNGADIRSIQTLMGHASLATTQIYTHTTFEQIRKVYESAHPRSKKKPTMD